MIPRNHPRLRRALATLACALLALAPLPAAVVHLAADDFAAPANITASASSQFAGLASLAQFRALPAAQRRVYSFETWPEPTASLGGDSYVFEFDLDGDGSADQRVTFSAKGKFGGGDPVLTRSTPGATAASPSNVLSGLGDIGWGSHQHTTHTIAFQVPVSAVGLVYRSSLNLLVQKIVSGQRDHPVSVTYADGSSVNLGQLGVLGATITANTNTFVGVIDPAGKGIIALHVRLQGSTGGAQFLTVDDLAFATMPAEPAVANPVNLRRAHDFRDATRIGASASAQLAGLASLAEFRSLARGNRHVYSFDTWPQAAASLGVNTYAFAFDRDGNGSADFHVTVSDQGSYAASVPLTRSAQTAVSSPGYALSGLGDIGWGGSTHAQQVFTFSQPVTAAGFVYRSTAAYYLRKNAGGAHFPVSYTLSDGSVVNLGASGAVGATLAANTNTFVGVIDSTGKGITSLTVRIQGSASGSQFVTIDDLAFVVAGPPPGTWTLTFDENFNGTTLDTTRWSKGMRWVDIINDELQGYVPENVTVAGGLCTIKAEKRTVQNRDMNNFAGATRDYASGAIQTYNKWTQAYGYFEARLKMTGGRGTWPAFWLLPDRGPGVTNLSQRVSVGNPGGLGLGNEFDVFEYMGTWKNQSTGVARSHSGYFWNYSGSGSWGAYAKENDGQGLAFFPLRNPDTEFHTYGLYWGPGVLVYYIDGHVVLRRDDPVNIGTVPHYLILNVAMSQNDWTGTTVPLSQIDATAPSEMVIDYVRVWSGTPAP